MNQPVICIDTELNVILTPIINDEDWNAQKSCKVAIIISAIASLVPRPSHVSQRVWEKSGRSGWFDDVMMTYLPPFVCLLDLHITNFSLRQLAVILEIIVTDKWLIGVVKQNEHSSTHPYPSPHTINQLYSARHGNYFPAWHWASNWE